MKFCIRLLCKLACMRIYQLKVTIVMISNWLWMSTFLVWDKRIVPSEVHWYEFSRHWLDRSSYILLKQCNKLLFNTFQRNLLFGLLHLVAMEFCYLVARKLYWIFYFSKFLMWAQRPFQWGKPNPLPCLLLSFSTILLRSFLPYSTQKSCTTLQVVLFIFSHPFFRWFEPYIV